MLLLLRACARHTWSWPLGRGPLKIRLDGTRRSSHGLAVYVAGCRAKRPVCCEVSAWRLSACHNTTRPGWKCSQNTPLRLQEKVLRSWRNFPHAADWSIELVISSLACGWFSWTRRFRHAVNFIKALSTWDSECVRRLRGPRTLPGMLWPRHVTDDHWTSIIPQRVSRVYCLLVRSQYYQLSTFMPSQ